MEATRTTYKSWDDPPSEDPQSETTTQGGTPRADRVSNGTDMGDLKNLAF